jgi:hypothetical protein
MDVAAAETPLVLRLRNRSLEPRAPEPAMQHLQDGQCGLCTHFGESHQLDARLVQLRATHEGPETLVDECGHPRHAPLHLKVTPISGCEGFAPAPVA